MEEIREWLIPLSTFITLISTSVGIWLSLKQYRIRVMAEIRLKESSQAEMDIRLLKTFTEILVIATGRNGEVFFSERIVDELIDKGLISTGDVGNQASLDQIRLDATKAAVLEPMVGRSSISAAFASIATLAKRHNVLTASAIQALEDFKSWDTQLAEKYLADIHSFIDQKNKQAYR